MNFFENVLIVFLFVGGPGVLGLLRLLLRSPGGCLAFLWERGGMKLRGQTSCGSVSVAGQVCCLIRSTRIGFVLGGLFRVLSVGMVVGDNRFHGPAGGLRAIWSLQV